MKALMSLALIVISMYFATAGLVGFTYNVRYYVISEPHIKTPESVLFFSEEISLPEIETHPFILMSI